MLRRLLTIATSAAAVAAVATAIAPGAGATSLTPGASAHSAGTSVGSATLQAGPAKITGSLGKIVGSVVGPIVQNDINPLVAALQGTVANLLALKSVSADTASSDAQVATAPPAWPNNTVPSPCPTGAHCYSAGHTTGSTASALLANLTGVDLTGLTGYVEQLQAGAASTDPDIPAGSNPIIARASLANLAVSVPLLQAGTVVSAPVAQSDANCPNDIANGSSKPTTSPTAHTMATGVSLLGGQISFNVTDGWPTNLVVGGVSLPDSLDKKGNVVPGLLSLTKTTLPGGISVARFGQGLSLSLTLSVAQVLGALGLPAAVVTALQSFTPKSTVVISVIVGSSATVTTTSANAWGLGVGVDLAGSLTFNIMGLVTATVTIPTGIASGNLGNVLDLRLAYSQCGSGTSYTPPAGPLVIPPALV